MKRFRTRARQLCSAAQRRQPHHLHDTRLGLSTARRAWLEAKDILNCQPLETLRDMVARKRAGG